MAIFDGRSLRQKKPIDPLKVLPHELVVDIFRLWLLDNLYPHSMFHHSQLPTLLCRVSKYWKDFIYASPLLWAHVIANASQGTVASLHVLQKRLRRSQSAPLFMEIMIRGDPDIGALRVLFAECSRFRQLTLDVQNVSWWGDIPMEGFTQLSHLSVNTWTDPGVLVEEDELSAIFLSAPRLRSVDWQSTADPGLVGVHGHQLRSLDLSAFRVPITRVLEVLAGCPNLRDAAICFEVQDDNVPMPLRERILLPELRSLWLHGTRHLACLLESVQAPLLSRLAIRWARFNGQVCSLEALESFLVYSPHLKDITLDEFLRTEDALISIITNNKNLLRLNVSARPGQRKLTTRRTFEFLTHQEHGKYALPQLEDLAFQGGLAVPDKVVLRMIESWMSPLGVVEYGSCSRRACTLKSFRMDDCKSMAVKAISRLEAICKESGLKAGGTFASRNYLREYIF